MADTPNYVADPTLWERAKRKVYGKSRSVDIYANTKIADEYERLGGRYRGSKPGKGRGIEKWFAERWVNLKDRKGGSFGPCGRKTAKPEDYATYLDFIDTYPKCVPLDKALAMTEAEREFAILNKDVALLRVKWLPGDPPASASTTPPKGSDIKAEVRRLREERKRLVAKVKREGVAWPPSRTASGPSTPEPQWIDWETYMRSRLPDPGLEHGALRATAQMSRRALRQHQARQREHFNVFFRDYDKVRAEYLQKIEAREIIDPSGSHYPSDETLDERITRLERMIEQMENAADFYEGEGLHDKARANRNVAARRRKAVERWKRERESQTPAVKESGIRRAKGKRPRGKGKRTVSGVGGRSPSGSITPVLERVTQKISDQMRREGWRDDERQKRYDEPTVWDINNGYCEDWAMAVEDEVEGAVMYWIEDLAPGDLGLSPVVVDKIASKAPSHAVIVYKGRFYDAQTPEGVESPLDLPLMRGVPRTYYVEGLRRAKGKRPKKGTTSGTVGFPKEVIEIKIPERDFLSMDPRSREYQENKAAQKRDLVDLAQALKNSAWTPGAERPSGVEVTTGKKSRSWIIAPLSTGEEGFRVGRWDPMGPSGHSDYKALGYGRDQDPADSESVWRKIALEELFYSGEYGREVDGEVEESDVMIFRFLTPKRSLVDWWIQQPLGQWGMQVVQARGEGNRLRFEGKYEEAAEYERQHMPLGPVPDPTPIPDTIGGAKVTQRRPGDGGHPVLSYTLTFAAEPYAKQRGVSKVARSPRGFMRAFEEAGSWENLSEWWKNRRNNFVARHMAQVEKRGEALWTKKGEPSRRHLALVMWAYTPDPKRFQKWLDEKLEERGRLLGGTTAGQVWYHGSPRQFDDFRTEVRHTFGSGPAETPLFFSPDLDFAKLYAGPKGTIYKVSLRYHKLFDGRKLIVSEQYWPPRREDLTQEGQALYDALEEGRIFGPISEDEWHGVFGDSQGLFAGILRGDYDIMETKEMRQWLRANGYDAFYVTGDGPRNIAVFDPQQVEVLESSPSAVSGLGKKERRRDGVGKPDIEWIEGWKAVYDTGESLQDPSFYYPLTPGARVDAPTEDGLWFTTKFTVALEYARQHGSKTLLKVRTARRAATPDPDTRGTYRTDFLEVVQVMDVGRTTGGPSSNLKALGTTVIDEGGVHFETGVPVRFRFIHNTDSSPFFGTEFQQHLEPGGFYLLHDETGTGPFVPGWQGGTAEVQSPIVLWHNTEQTIGYDEHSWKARLFDKFGSGSREPRGQKAARRQNEKLRQAILAAGYDAVVTVRRSDEPSTLEIVLLDPENQIVEVGDPVK